MELISHTFAFSETLVAPAGAIEYVVGADGLYLRAGRSGMSVVGQLAAAPVRGLAEIRPTFTLTVPPVPPAYLFQFLMHSVRACDEHGRQIEALAYLAHTDGRWAIHYPDVVATATSVRPVEEYPEGYEDALVEIHSHHSMAARFSPTDDVDEVGFRIYAVVGSLGSSRPEIAVRLGVYGYFFELPADAVFEQAGAVMDLVASLVPNGGSR